MRADRRIRALVGLVALAALLSLGGAACGGGDDDGAPELFVPLDGSPRVPDAEGVLVEVADDFTSLTLDDDRTYDVHEDLQSFAAGDGSLQPVGRYEGNYVQVGIQDGEVVWLGSIASVVRVPGDPDLAYVTGSLRSAEDGRLVLDSGIVLAAADDLDLPDLPTAAVLTIDVASRTVVAVDRA